MIKLKKKHIIGLLLITLLAVLWSYQYIRLNKQYPPPTEKAYDSTEPMVDNQFQTQVTQHYFMDQDQLKEVFAKEIEMQQNIKCMVIELEVKNIGNEPQQLNLAEVILQSGAWKNGISIQGFMLLNSKKSSLKCNLDVNESVQLIIPFTMIDRQVKKGSWNTVEQKAYDLIFSLYPVKKYIHIS